MRRKKNLRQWLEGLIFPGNREENILFLHVGGELYGADKILLEILKGIDKSKFKPVVILPEPGELVHHIERLKIKVYIRELAVLKPKHFSYRGRLKLLYQIFLALIRVLQLSRKHKFLLIHSSTSFVLAGGVAAKILGIPHVWHIHEIINRPRMRRAFCYLIPRFSDVAVAVSYAVKNHMVKWSRSKKLNILVIHNGISSEPYLKIRSDTIRYELGFGLDDILIGMVGRVNYWKGHDLFLDVAANLLQERTKIKFLLVGGTHEGEEYRLTALHERVKKEKMDPYVYVSDYRYDIPDILASLDIFVVPSIEPDPFPTVILEAMCSGKPIVSFSHGGIPEMIANGTSGLLVTPVDRGEMKEAIKKLIDDPGCRTNMGARGRDCFYRRFTQKPFISKMEGVYSELIG